MMVEVKIGFSEEKWCRVLNFEVEAPRQSDPQKKVKKANAAEHLRPMEERTLHHFCCGCCGHVGLEPEKFPKSSVCSLCLSLLFDLFLFVLEFILIKVFSRFAIEIVQIQDKGRLRPMGKCPVTPRPMGATPMRGHMGPETKPSG